MWRHLKKYISILCFLVLLLALNTNTNAQRIEIPDAGELQIALHKLAVLGSVLYVAAHPDDENTAALAYFSKGRKYRTAYLSFTRGDGGQNLIGPEKGAEIGIIRTQELLAARRIDGAEQFFTRAIDFGYSKTPAETLEFWGKEEILSDLVWVIRKFRPDVVISRFSTDGSSGHGHHTASGWLIKEAFHAASDPQKFPEQLEYAKPWAAKRLYWNSWRPREQETQNLQRIDAGEYNPLLGKSYSEMAAESRSNHKSQGFGATGRRGIQYDYFRLIAGTPASIDPFDGIDTSWKRVPGSQKLESVLADVLESYDPRHPAKSIPGLLTVYEELTKLDETYWVSIKKEELLHVIQACAGLWIEAIAGDFAAAPGDKIEITTTIVNRSDFPFRIQKLGIPPMIDEIVLDRPLSSNAPQSAANVIEIPADFPISQPYWLKAEPKKGIFVVREQGIIGVPENAPSIVVKVFISANENVLEYSLPVLFRWRDRVDGELYRSFEIRPPVTMQVENKVNIFPNDQPKKIKVKMKSHSPNVSGQIWLKGGENWQISPDTIPFSITNKYEEQEFTFEVIPPKASDETVLTAEAEIDSKIMGRGLVEISYPHIHRQIYFPESRVRVVKLDVKRTGKMLGYIMGAGDEVAAGLRNLGFEVIELNDEMLENGEFSQFDAIITGIRAYNTRERLKHVQGKLLQYVENGGTLIVQYNVSRGMLIENVGPYPLTIGRDRVSMETAPVRILDPGHPLMNYPNRITPKDFEGWIQERGLYFASRWDEKYETVLSSHDTNETEKNGGLLYTRYGKGVFIYTGYSWFRQLPAGVPGAFRLFANMISAGKSDEKPKQ
ncbi:MAG: PIG-L family deacetylase [Candidatus Aminicenantes bacterium]|nr:MAG: PIG-L family deacetylase [Candidatus Aminicenantes bacterium]